MTHTNATAGGPDWKGDVWDRSRRSGVWWQDDVATIRTTVLRSNTTWAAARYMPWWFSRPINRSSASSPVMRATQYQCFSGLYNSAELGASNDMSLSLFPLFWFRTIGLPGCVWMSCFLAGGCSIPFHHIRPSQSHIEAVYSLCHANRNWKTFSNLPGPPKWLSRTSLYWDMLQTCARGFNSL